MDNYRKKEDPVVNGHLARRRYEFYGDDTVDVPCPAKNKSGVVGEGIVGCMIINKQLEDTSV